MSSMITSLGYRPNSLEFAPNIGTIFDCSYVGVKLVAIAIIYKYHTPILPALDNALPVIIDPV